MDFKAFTQSLETKIQNAYTEGVTVLEAEKLAGEFLFAQLKVSAQLTTVDLDARMRKTGVKAVKAAIYMGAATKDPKKPSDVMLQAIVDMHEVVQSEQNNLDTVEVSRAELERFYDIFLNAHIYFRAISKGSFSA